MLYNIICVSIRVLFRHVFDASRGSQRWWRSKRLIRITICFGHFCCDSQRPQLSVCIQMVAPKFTCGNEVFTIWMVVVLADVLVVAVVIENILRNAQHPTYTASVTRSIRIRWFWKLISGFCWHNLFDHRCYRAFRCDAEQSIFPRKCSQHFSVDFYFSWESW